MLILTLILGVIGITTILTYMVAIWWFMIIIGQAYSQFDENSFRLLSLLAWLWTSSILTLSLVVVTCNACSSGSDPYQRIHKRTEERKEQKGRIQIENRVEKKQQREWEDEGMLVLFIQMSSVPMQTEKRIVLTYSNVCLCQSAVTPTTVPISAPPTSSYQSIILILYFTRVIFSDFIHYKGFFNY